MGRKDVAQNKWIIRTEQNNYNGSINVVVVASNISFFVGKKTGLYAHMMNNNYMNILCMILFIKLKVYYYRINVS